MQSYIFFSELWINYYYYYYNLYDKTKNTQYDEHWNKYIIINLHNSKPVFKLKQFVSINKTVNILLKSNYNYGRNKNIMAQNVVIVLKT